MDGYHRRWEGFVVEIAVDERKTVFFLRRMLGTPAATLAQATRIHESKKSFFEPQDNGWAANENLPTTT
jgi:hypothetical protein